MTTIKTCGLCNGEQHIVVRSISSRDHPLPEERLFSCPTCNRQEFEKQFPLTWLKREKDSEAKAPFVMANLITKQVCLFKELNFHCSFDPAWTHYLPLPPLPTEKRDEDEAFRKFYSQYHVRFRDESDARLVFNAARKNEGE